MKKPLKVEKLRRACTSKELKCESSDQVKPLESIIGQPRAVKALETGLRIRGKGYNIYVAGRSGTGKLTAVNSFLNKLAAKDEVPPDTCYVNNFRNSYCPKVIRLKAGTAREFKNDMKTLVQEVQQGLHQAFSSDEFSSRHKEIVSDTKKKKNALFSELNEKVLQEGLMIRNTAVGIYTVPMKENRAMTDEEFNSLGKEKRDRITKKQEEFQVEIKDVVKEARKLEKEMNENIHELQRNTALFAIETIMDDVEEKYKEMEEILEYLKEVQNDILENLQLFTNGEQDQQEGGAQHSPFNKYDVNILVDNSELKGAPVVIEQNPTYANLFGKVEKESHYGTLVTDFTFVRNGALHRANGGYLVIPTRELLTNPFSWDSLKRALRKEQIEIEDPGDMMGFFSARTVSPEEVPLDIKVLLLDERQLYRLLYEYDADFKELFKIKADFDTTMERSGAHISSYSSFVCKVCNEEDLLHLNKGALARLVEYSSRVAEDQEKLTASFGQITDLIREASYYAMEEQKEYVEAEHIKKAEEESLYRSNLLQVKIKELMEDGTLQIDIEGEEVGQVNGLSVYDLGDVSFGKPTRITANTSIGKSGIVDIERKAELGGPIHTKGVMILSGYLASQFGQDRPINLSASLVFEQSYSEVEGDSASSTELYALLSSLSGLPIKQGIAVTGSVNQKGEVQAIGGVNQKIEGFFEVCTRKGLSGGQGVIIPHSNVRHLMLKDEVLDAVKAGDFNIWSVEHVDEGIKILTGKQAGSPQKVGGYTSGSVKGLVDERLKSMSQQLVEYGSNNEHPKNADRKIKRQASK